MTDSSKRIAIGIQLGIMLASIGVFIAGVQLVGGGFEDRGSRFWMTLVSIVFAQVVWFNVPVWMMATDARDKDSFPFQFTAVTFCTLYALAVFLLALLVVFTEISSGWVGLGNLVLLFFLLSSLGLYAVASQAVDTMDAADKRDKAVAAQLALHMQAVSDRATMCEVAGVGVAKNAIAELAEAMRYATAESLPGSEGIDSEVTGHFKTIEMALMDLDEADGEDAVTALVGKIATQSF